MIAVFYVRKFPNWIFEFEISLFFTRPATPVVQWGVLFWQARRRLCCTETTRVTHVWLIMWARGYRKPRTPIQSLIGWSWVELMSYHSLISQMVLTLAPRILEAVGSHCKSIRVHMVIRHPTMNWKAVIWERWLTIIEMHEASDYLMEKLQPHKRTLQHYENILDFFILRAIHPRMYATNPSSSRFRLVQKKCAPAWTQQLNQSLRQSGIDPMASFTRLIRAFL